MTELSDLKNQYGLGWIPDYPDFRDYTPETQQVAELLAQSEKTKMLGTPKAKELAPAAPGTYDLRSWFSPIDDQDGTRSCTAHAADGIFEYGELRAFGSYIDISRRFVYYVTRKLSNLPGDNGAYIRGTMGTLALFGAPPENYWEWDTHELDEEPSAFVYAFAQNYRATVYYRLDEPGMTTNALLDRIKLFVAAGFPPMFGFPVYTCRRQAVTTGLIPFPVLGDRVEGGHAVVVAGYDDYLKIKNAAPGATETTGALLFKNSWGSGWGAQGYGWLPYEYVLRGLTDDWWSILNETWVATGQFGF